MFDPANMNTITAYCAGCGSKMEQISFDGVEQQAKCPTCNLFWLILWDQDSDGNYGVMAFVCDNEDRQAEGRKWNRSFEELNL